MHDTDSVSTHALAAWTADPATLTARHISGLVVACQAHPDGGYRAQMVNFAAWQKRQGQPCAVLIPRLPRLLAQAGQALQAVLAAPGPDDPP